MIKIWDEDKPQHFIRLCEALNKDSYAARLVITDSEGRRVNNGTILAITQAGKLEICAGIDSKIAEIMGIQLDANGRIVVANDDD